MSYVDLTEALQDLDPSTVRVDLKNKRVTISNVCEDGIEAILEHAKNYWGEKDILAIFPALNNLDKSTLLATALDNDELWTLNELIKCASNASDTTSTSSKMAIGDKFVASREITDIGSVCTTFKDQNGILGIILSSSFKGWTKDKIKE